MKNMGSFVKFITTASVAVAITLLAGYTFTTSAQEKGATKLMQSPSAPAVSGATGLDKMACSRCKVSQATVTEKSGKTGATAYAQVVSSHKCPGCGEKIVTTGHGKAKSDSITHVCTVSGSAGADCCVTAK